jgi:translocation and assembly module TamA
MVEGQTGFVPVGGNGLLDGSLELRFPLPGSWGGAVFVDYGNVSLPSALPSAWQGALDLSLLQWASGLALRYRTPLGPFRVDMGVRLPTSITSGGGLFGASFHFPTVPVIQCLDRNTNQTIACPGGTLQHSEPIVAVHISLGEAF